MEYYFLGENQASETFCSKFIRLENFKILSTLWGHKNAQQQNFWNLNIFLHEKTSLYRYYQNKNKLEDMSSSYINLTMNLLMKSYLFPQKQSKSQILCFFGKLYLNLWHNFLYFSSLNLIRIETIISKEQKAVFKSQFQNLIMVVQNSKTRWKLTKYKQSWAAIVV